MMARSLASSLGIGTALLLGGCPDDATPIDTDSDASSTSTGMVDSTTLPPDLDTSSSTTGPDPDSGSSTTAPDPETSTGPVDDCGNGAIDEGEVCDGAELAGETCVSQGFDEGTLGCREDCSDYDRTGCNSFVCGNNTIDPDEVCDGTDLGGITCEGMGFDSGTPVCSNDCTELDLGECGTCGNVIVDGDEVCDGIVLLGQTCESQGYSSGQLGCNADCVTYDFANCIMCGNDLIDGVEPCDGVDLGGATCVSEGYVGGTLACDEDCAFDISACNTCGNVLVDVGETCDGANLNGEDCASLGLGGGALACTPGCFYDFAGCDIAGFPFGSDVGYQGLWLEPGILPCDDISVTGTNTNLFDDDEIVVNLGFTFDFYDVPFTQINIGSNGYVYFGPADSYQLYGECFPGDSFALLDENLLGVFWRDLDPSAAGAVRYQTLGPAGNQRFVVQWDVPFYAGPVGDLLRLQAVMHEAGHIDVCYVDTFGGAGEFGNDGADASAGIQQDPLVGFGYSCQLPNLTSGLLLMYVPL